MLGYDIGVVTGALESLEKDWGKIDGAVRGLIVAALPLGQAPGALFGGFVSDRYGRSRGIMIQCTVYMIGGMILATAPDVELLLLGRFVVGLGVGISVASNVPWMSETCPAKRRGSVTSFYELMITIGVFLGYLMFYIMKDTQSGWRYMFLMSCILATPQCVFVWFMPESPQWLFSRGRERDAEMQLMRMHEYDSNRVRLAMKSIRADVASSRKDESQKLDEWKEPLIVILTLTFLAFWTGGINVRTYAPRIYTSVGMSDSMAASMTVVLGSVKVLSTLVAVLFIDEFGRKALLRTGILIAAVASFLLIMIDVTNLDGGFGDAMVVVALSLYVFHFSCVYYIFRNQNSKHRYVVAYQTSFGPCLFTVGAEMFPSLIRGKMMSFQIIFASLSDSSCTEIFSVLLDEFGVMIPFAGHFLFCVAGYVFVKTCFVETTEKRPIEIRDELKQNTSLQYFIGCLCCNSCRCVRSCMFGERVVNVPLALARKFTSSGFESLPASPGDVEDVDDDGTKRGEVSV